MKQKRTQLNYQDVTPCHDEVVNKWRSLLGKVKSAADPDHKVIPKVDLWALVKDGRFMFIISVGFLIILWLLCVNHPLISLLRTPRTPTINLPKHTLTMSVSLIDCKLYTAPFAVDAFATFLEPFCILCINDYNKHFERIFLFFIYYVQRF